MTAQITDDKTLELSRRTFVKGAGGLTFTFALMAYQNAGCPLPGVLRSVLKFDVSTTRVLPSQRPRETPVQERTF